MRVQLQPADLTMARHVATKYGPSGDGEIESAAMEGLLTAAHTFDGVSAWRSYAMNRVRWSILDHLKQRRDMPVDPITWPDTAKPLHSEADPTALDEETIETIHEVLAGFDASDALDQLDRRRKAHRQAVEYLRKVMA